MKILRIFDVSSFVHAGKVSKTKFLLPELKDDPDGFREERIYCGGVNMLWNVLYEEFGKCDLVFCCDRRPTIKQGMSSSYKGSRVHDSEVSKSKEVCEYILRDCGFTVLVEDGYEADDFIYSLVQDNKDAYDHIYVYTGDSDLYMLVSENVSIEPSSTRAKRVNMQNFTYTVKKDGYVPYNMLTFEKILYGDKSDDIAALPKEIASRMYPVYNIPLWQKHLADKETLQYIGDLWGPMVRAQVDLVLPLDVRTPREFGQGDKLRVAEWGDAIKNKFWRTGNGYTPHVKECVEEMSKLGLGSDE